MKFSIITVVRNGENHIADCLLSVQKQTHRDIEHIIVDGASSDRTLSIIESLKTSSMTVILERDGGLYEAMNKGLKLATGDIIGTLNSDDFYAHPDALSQVASMFEKVDSPIVIGDLEFVRPSRPAEVTRYLSPKHFEVSDFLLGECPPHPAFFARRELYEKHGAFNTLYRVCADYDLMLRFLYLHKERWAHIPHSLVKMRTGGVSNRSLLEKLRLNTDKVSICRSHGLDTTLFKMYSRYPGKAYKLLSYKLAALLSRKSEKART